MDVDVEQADLPPREGERGGEVGGDGALADAALSGKDDDGVADAGEVVADAAVNRVLFLSGGVGAVPAVAVAFVFGHGGRGNRGGRKGKGAGGAG